MLHFPSTNGSNGFPGRSDSLNATQQKASSNPVFMKIEEELHDARRVQMHGQEEDLRQALDMVIKRVTALSSLLGEAYKSQADLEVQLNVTKSNLKLVISNNEMLEDALRKDDSGQAKEVGWRRRSGRDSDSSRDPRSSLERQQSAPADTPTHLDGDQGSAMNSPSTPAPTPTPTLDNRFFKFRFNSTSTASTSRPISRPGTPTGNHLTSPSMPILPSRHPTKEIEELTAELEKEKKARKAIVEEKALLESELESLSQALFEEANKMVATERMKRAETEDELKQLQQEKDALRSALRVIEGENHHLRKTSMDTSPSVEEAYNRLEHEKGGPRNALRKIDDDKATSSIQALSSSSSPSSDPSPPSVYDERTPPSPGRSRSSSVVALKSRPSSLSLPPLPPSDPPSPSPIYSPAIVSSPEDEQEEDSQPTPRYHASRPTSAALVGEQLLDPDPWADTPSSSSFPSA